MSILGQNRREKAEDISRYLYAIEKMGKKVLRINHHTFNKSCNDGDCFAHAIIGTGGNTTENINNGSIQLKGSKCQVAHWDKIDSLHDELKVFIEELKKVADHTKPEFSSGM